MTDQALLQQALKHVARDEIITACRYWELLKRSKLRSFEWVVGKAFTTQNGMINLHGEAAHLFYNGEVITFNCPETGHSFSTKITGLGVLLSGPGTRCAKGFAGLAQASGVVPNRDRLAFEETERGKFTVTIRRLDSELVSEIKKVQNKHQRSMKRSFKHGQFPRLMPLNMFKKYVNPQSKPKRSAKN